MFYFRVPQAGRQASRQHRVMSSSRVRLSLHISAHKGVGVGGRREGVKKAKACEGVMGVRGKERRKNMSLILLWTYGLKYTKMQIRFQETIQITPTKCISSRTGCIIHVAT